MGDSARCVAHQAVSTRLFRHAQKFAFNGPKLLPHNCPSCLGDRHVPQIIRVSGALSTYRGQTGKLAVPFKIREQRGTPLLTPASYGCTAPTSIKKQDRPCVETEPGEAPGRNHRKREPTV